MKIDFKATVHGNLKGNKLFVMFPIEDAGEPFCWNSPFFIRAKDEKDAIKEALKILSDGTYSITKKSIEENNDFFSVGTIEE